MGRPSKEAASETDTDDGEWLQIEADASRGVPAGWVHNKPRLVPILVKVLRLSFTSLAASIHHLAEPGTKPPELIVSCAHHCPGPSPGHSSDSCHTALIAHTRGGRTRCTRDFSPLARTIVPIAVLHRCQLPLLPRNLLSQCQPWFFFTTLDTFAIVFTF